jgi:prolyl oligopeptidase
VGHGARAVSRTVGLAADQLGFLAAHTGLGTRPGGPVAADAGAAGPSRA